MNIDPAWLATFSITIIFTVFGFFIKRMVSNIDRNTERINEKIDKMRDRIINQREKQAVHEAKVDQELLQVEKNIEICLTELRTLHQLQLDVNNIGYKVRKIEEDK